MIAHAVERGINIILVQKDVLTGVSDAKIPNVNPVSNLSGSIKGGWELQISYLDYTGTKIVHPLVGRRIECFSLSLANWRVRTT